MAQQLVIQLARFGDLVQSRRLLHSLLSQADDEIHLCLDQSLALLASILYPSVVLHPIAAHGTGLAPLPPLEQAACLLSSNLPVFREISQINFARIYNLNFSPLNFRVASLFDPDRVRGHVWHNGQERVGQWARLAMRWSAMRRIGINIADFWAWHHPKPIEPKQVNPSAKSRGGGLGVVLAGRESRRSLPPKVLARLVGGLVDLHGWRLTLLGSASESNAARQLLRELPGKHASQAVNLCGKTGWKGLVDSLGTFDLLLTPDTGTMHLAAFLGVPTLATFLSSAWCHETGPYGLGHKVLQANTDCLPCLESQECHFDVQCLQPFVDDGLLRFLATNDAARAPGGLLALESGFDELGATFKLAAGQDPDLELRARFRKFLLRHLSAGAGWEHDDLSGLAQRFYSESDWLVPDLESTLGRQTGSGCSVFD